MNPRWNAALFGSVPRGVTGRVMPPAGLWRAAALGIALRVGGSFVQFSLFVLLARLMSAEEFGRLGWAYGMAMTLAVVAGLGQAPLVARSWHFWLRDPGHLAAARRGLKIGYAVSLAGSAALAPIALLDEVFGSGLFPSRDVVVPTSVLVVVYALSELQSFAMRADDRIAAGLAPRDIGWRSLVMTIAATAALFTGPPSAVSILWLMVLSLALIVLLQGSFWWFDLCRRSATGPAAPPGRFDWRSWRTLSLSVWLSSIGTAFAQHADVALVGWVLGPTEAAVYLAAARTSQILQLLPTALTAVLIPQAARAALDKGRDGLSAVIAVNNRIVFLPAVASTLLLLAIPERALSLFGASFSDAADVLRILATGHLIAIMCGPIVSICVGAGYQHAYTLAVGSGAALLATGVPLLATTFGIKGAAVASALATALPPLVLRLWLFRRVGIDTGTLGGPYERN